MGAKRVLKERSFEHALLEVLEQDYDLKVRLDSDCFERRLKDTVTLQFHYQYDSAHPRETKAIVMIEHLEDFSYTIFVDFSSTESIVASAEDCEDLAAALAQHAPTWDDQFEEAFWKGDSPRLRFDD